MEDSLNGDESRESELPCYHLGRRTFSGSMNTWKSVSQQSQPEFRSGVCERAWSCSKLGTQRSQQPAAATSKQQTTGACFRLLRPALAATFDVSSSPRKAQSPPDDMLHQRHTSSHRDLRLRATTYETPDCQPRAQK